MSAIFRQQINTTIYLLKKIMRHIKAIETQMCIYLQVVQDDASAEKIIINANQMRQFRI